MLKRILFPAFIACITLMALPADSQVAGDAQAQMAQQLQDMRAQIVQNLQQQGIDPIAFGQQLRDKMQDPNYDPADLQQMLIDQGLIDEGAMTRLQGTVQTYALNAIKQQLNSTDEEWTILLPKLQTLLKAMAEVEPRGQTTATARYISGQSPGEVSRALKDLRAAVNDPTTPPEQLAIKLRTWHAARAKAKANWDAAEKDFVGVLTLGQETVLLDMGVIR